MDPAILSTALAIVLLLLLSAFFSGSETALTAASPTRLQKLAPEGDRRLRLVNKLRDNRDDLIGALLLGNNLAKILACALATSLLLRLFGNAGIVYATIGVTALVLIFSEILPRTYALRHADRFALKVSPGVRLFVLLTRPLTRLIGCIAQGVLAMFGKQSTGVAPSSIDELRGAIELPEMPDEQRAMLRSILDLSEVQVQDVMVPRGRIHALDVDQPVATLIDEVAASPYTRIPLWREEPDNIIGILHAKTVLQAVCDRGNDLDSLDVMALSVAPNLIVPSTRLIDQLHAFRRTQAHMALIVNEYGGLAGLVTLEDILEEIVGDIYDEHERPENAIRIDRSGAYRVKGWVTLRDLNRRFNWRLPDDDASTIAGLVMSEAETIPPEGETVSIPGFDIEVVKRSDHTITEVRIRPCIEVAAEDEEL